MRAQSFCRKNRILAPKLRSLYWFYNLALQLASFILGILARFNPKMRLFIGGRKAAFPKLESALSGIRDVLWVHTASLGEFEQGLPVIRKLREEFPSHTVLVTFFSPSGYEVKKNTREADVVTYLPWDTVSNVKRFLDLVSPALAIFVKYEVWPNYYRELANRGIPLLLISALFKRKQAYFQWYGGFLRRSLHKVSCFFVQDEGSAILLRTIGITDVVISGDTRFDRVWEIRQRDNTLAFMATFKKNDLCLVAGSTWPEDEAFLAAYINRAPDNLKFVLVPHDIREEHLAKLQESIDKEVVCYTQLATGSIENARVLIIDTIGLLTSIYSYADLAYVGGGFATGLHNTLEPAAFGIPVITGPGYTGFREAEDLFALKGLAVGKNQQTLNENIEHLVDERKLRTHTGRICEDYVKRQQGATDRIMEHIHKFL
jgi:3-deoxy-D-manno-octulosonic-acid transferase